jgi:type VI protein secretion system component Hcp
MTIRSTGAIALALSFAVLTWAGAARAKDNSPHAQQQQHQQPVVTPKTTAKSSPVLHEKLSVGKHFKKAIIE